MRPDKHKKKKSQAHQKQNAGKKDGGGGKSSAAAGGNKGGGGKNQPPQVPQQQLPARIERQNFDDHEYSHDQFKKRAVENNWEKYEESAEELRPIAPSWHDLLASASGPSSRLITDVENDWDLYPEFDEMFEPECEQIYAVMGKLDFCERFDFDPNDIDAELLRDLKQEASCGQQKVKATISDDSVQSDWLLDTKKIVFSTPTSFNNQPPPPAATAAAVSTQQSDEDDDDQVDEVCEKTVEVKKTPVKTEAAAAAAAATVVSEVEPKPTPPPSQTVTANADDGDHDAEKLSKASSEEKEEFEEEIDSEEEEEDGSNSESDNLEEMENWLDTII